MIYIDWVEIENFKGLDRKVRVPLGDPSVLIGPNNAGKTTVLQALSLWSRAVRAWVAKKGSGHQKAKRDAVGINRLLIMDIPVKETRYFWNATRINANRKNIPFSISAGVRLAEGEVRELKMVFSYRDPETLYSKPDDGAIGDSALLEAGAKIDFNLLYPMSGLASGDDGHVEETMLTPGRVNVLLGQGQTAQVLRNLCYKVAEHDREDWQKIADIIRHVFGFELKEPQFDETRGAITLEYTQTGMNAPLEISLAGRGAQQMLLILAYLYSHKGGVLMIDEPDAHLEILRQKQVLVILKDISAETRSQIVVATHSEVILDEAVDTNLTCIVNGGVSELSNRNDIKTTLKSLGVQHYYNAFVRRRLLVVEGSTDVAMLREFARKLGHPAFELLECPFTFYMQDENLPNPTLGDRIDRQSMCGIDYRQYFHTLKRLVKDLKAIAIRDGDGKKHVEERDVDGLQTCYWTRYELENYFITPERLIAFTEKEIGKLEGEIFAVSPGCRADMECAMEDVLAELVFDGKRKLVEEYRGFSPDMKARQLETIKMSAFAERYFERFAELHHVPVLLNKGVYWKMIADLTEDDVPTEVREMLDRVVEVLRTDKTESRES